MNKLFLLTSLLWIFLLAGCSIQKSSTRQGAYYYWWTQDSDINYWPVFTDYEACKDRAITKKYDAYNGYAYCSKNCHDSVDGIPICEEVVRSWKPLPSSNSFDNYKE